MTVDLIGWASSLVLFATLITQIHRQWRARDTEGVSPWLFIGQMTASVGFTTYSALIGNWIFVITNVVLALAALAGLLVLKLHEKGHDHDQAPPPGPAARSGDPAREPHRRSGSPRSARGSAGEPAGST